MSDSVAVGVMGESPSTVTDLSTALVVNGAIPPPNFGIKCITSDQFFVENKNILKTKILFFVKTYLNVS